MLDTGLLLLRLVLGLYLFAHGAQKLFGWFHGFGFTGVTGWFTMMGFQPAPLWAFTAGAGELTGGLLVLFGFLNPLGALAIAASMAVATFGVHWSKGPFELDGGFELPLTDLAVAVAIALTGPGRYSLDALLRITLPPLLEVFAAVMVVLAVAAALVGRKPERAPVPVASESA